MPGKKTLISGAAIGSLLVIALVAFWPVNPPPPPPSPHAPGVTKENLKKLHAAMKAKDVADLFGCTTKNDKGPLIIFPADNLVVTLDSEGYVERYAVGDGVRDVGTTIELEQTWFIKVQRWFRSWK